jgi:hypothetical protein
VRSCWHCNEIPFIHSQKRNCASLSPNFHIHVSVSNLYIPRIGLHFSCSRIGRPIVEIYKSLKDSNVEIGTEAAQFLFCENLFRILVLCLCRVRTSLCSTRKRTSCHFCPFLYLAGNFMLTKNLQVMKVSCPNKVEKHDFYKY